MLEECPLKTEPRSIGGGGSSFRSVKYVTYLLCRFHGNRLGGITLNPKPYNPEPL